MGQVMENYRDKNKDVHMIFIDLKKAQVYARMIFIKLKKA